MKLLFTLIKGLFAPRQASAAVASAPATQRDNGSLGLYSMLCNMDNNDRR